MFLSAAIRIARSRASLLRPMLAAPNAAFRYNMKPRFAFSTTAPKLHEGDRIKIDKPSLMLAFTCKKCGTRSSHIISKQAYQIGSVMVQCPGCKNRHLIADHLNIFHDGKINIEELMKAQGQDVTSDVHDLSFEDIPPELKKMLGKYAKDAPADFKEETSANDNESPQLAEGKPKKPSQE